MLQKLWDHMSGFQVLALEGSSRVLTYGQEAVPGQGGSQLPCSPVVYTRVLDAQAPHKWEGNEQAVL